MSRHNEETEQEKRERRQRELTDAKYQLPYAIAAHQRALDEELHDKEHNGSQRFLELSSKRGIISHHIDVARKTIELYGNTEGYKQTSDAKPSKVWDETSVRTYKQW